ncbi:hypothetical protein ACS0TY_036409 [Phlomoides rotata]
MFGHRDASGNTDAVLLIQSLSSLKTLQDDGGSDTILMVLLLESMVIDTNTTDMSPIMPPSNAVSYSRKPHISDHFPFSLSGLIPRHLTQLLHVMWQVL